jgi:hypothetical protein
MFTDVYACHIPIETAYFEQLDWNSNWQYAIFCAFVPKNSTFEQRISARKEKRKHRFAQSVPKSRTATPKGGRCCLA